MTRKPKIDKSVLFKQALTYFAPALLARFIPEYRFARAAIDGKHDGPAKPGLRKRLEEVGLGDWRFDWACPSHLVAIEVDGNAWRVKGGGRHGTDSDRDKLNAAAVLGWRVLRFSPKQLERNPAKCAKLAARAIGMSVGVAA